MINLRFKLALSPICLSCNSLRGCQGTVSSTVSGSADGEQPKFRKLELLPKQDEKTYWTPKHYDHSPRSLKMSPNQDWPSVWPTAQSFKASVVPLPIRMGWALTRRHAPPGKHGNVELMKIPNFFHLTPIAIKRHCAAIKKFCTPWPKGIDTNEECFENFPIEFSTSDYCHAGSSIRDARARIVTLTIKLSVLNLDYHARDKFRRLVGPDRYDAKTDIVTIVTDRCPARQQNKDYALYLLTALYYESQKREPWEDEKTDADMEKFFWDGSRSQKRAFALIRQMRRAFEAANNKKRTDMESVTAEEPPSDVDFAFPEHVKSLEDSGVPDERLKSLAPMRDYYDAWDKYRNEPESAHNLARYGQSVRQLLGIPQLAATTDGLDEKSRLLRQQRVQKRQQRTE